MHTKVVLILSHYFHLKNIVIQLAAAGIIYAHCVLHSHNNNFCRQLDDEYNMPFRSIVSNCLYTVCFTWIIRTDLSRINSDENVFFFSKKFSNTHFEPI